MKEPEVVGIVSIQAVKSFEPIEEGPPSTGKLGPNFDPESFDTGVVSRPA
jgi:hypothetical protein